MRNSEIAKFGTRAERNTQLWQYAQKNHFRMTERRKRKSQEQHALSKELKKKYRGDIDIRHREADNASGFFLANSTKSKAMSTRKPKKPQAGTSRSRKLSATPNT